MVSAEKATGNRQPATGQTKYLPQLTTDHSHTGAVRPLTTALTLANGLRLLTEERPGAALTALEITVKSGSGAETAQDAGAAHLVEHMVFRGSAGRKPGEFDTAMETLGGEIQARTTRDVTQYSVVLPSAKWRDGLKLMAEMVRTPIFPAAQLAREKMVVRQEMAVAQSDTARTGFDKLCALSFLPVDPYASPLMGTRAGMESLAVLDLTDFHKTRYVPANMSVTMVGAASAEDARAAVTALFPGGAATPPLDAPLLSVASERIARAEPIPPNEQTERELATLMLAFAAPPAATPDAIPLFDALMPLLADGRDGSLSARLVRQDHLALSVTAEWVPMRRGSLIVLTAVARPKDIKAVEKGILGEIRRLREDGLSDKDTEDAKRTALSRARYAAANVEGRARQLAMRDAYNPALTDETYAKRLASLTPNTLQEALLRYLTPTRYSAVVSGRLGEERSAHDGSVVGEAGAVR